MDPVLDYMKDFLESNVAAMHKMGVDSETPRNPFIRNVVLHPELYNSDEEAKKHDLSTSEGVILSMMRQK